VAKEENYIDINTSRDGIEGRQMILLVTMKNNIMTIGEESQK
jgi:hypothetical protein